MSDFVDVWAQVPEFEGRYDVSSRGAVRSWLKPGRGSATRLEQPRPLAARTDKKSGHQRVNLVTYVNEVQVIRSFLVHRLVLLAFRGPPPRGHEGCHANGEVGDNRLENLCWSTRRRNSLDAMGRKKLRQSRPPVGEAVKTSKLTVGKVRDMRRMWAAGTWTLEPLATIFGVSAGTVSRIVARKAWKHV